MIESWKIDVKDDGTMLVVRPSGELDMSTSPELLGAFAGCGDGHRALICDVSEITFIDSSGIHALLTLHDGEPGRFALAGQSEPVERLLELTGTQKHFRRVQAP